MFESLLITKYTIQRHCVLQCVAGKEKFSKVSLLLLLEKRVYIYIYICIYIYIYIHMYIYTGRTMLEYQTIFHIQILIILKSLLTTEYAA